MKKWMFGAFGLAVLLLLCSGCVREPSSSMEVTAGSDSEAVRDVRFVDTLPESDLPRPDRLIESPEDFIYALDYLAFYRITGGVAFSISESYAASISGIYREFSRICQLTQLAGVYPITLDQSQYSSRRVISIDLRSVSVADDSPGTVDTAMPAVLPFNYDPDLNARTPDFDDFAINKSNLGSVTVETGEQLWYTVQLGYLPVPVPDSAAERLLSEAKRILRRIVSDDMNDYEACHAIYHFLTCEVHYDSATANASSPDSVHNQSYYLEGVLLNRLAVCDGKAKAYCLLAGMEGIPIVRVTDRKENRVGHAYNYVNIQGNWYLSCSTFGASVMNLGTEDDPEMRIVPQQNLFLTSAETPLGSGWGYDSMMYPDIKVSIQDGFFDYWGYTEVDVNGTHQTLAVSSAEELCSLIRAIADGRSSLENTILEFRLDGASKSVSEIYNDLTAAFSQYEICLLQSRPVELEIYSLVFLKNG